MSTREKTIYDTYMERCAICGAGKKSWHHNPPIGGSAHDHKFKPSSSVIEALCAIGAGRPFHSVEFTDFEFYALRSWALKGLAAEAKEHEECGRVGCDTCAMREAALRHEAQIQRSREDSRRASEQGFCEAVES